MCDNLNNSNLYGTTGDFDNNNEDWTSCRERLEVFCSKWN